jgi:outer membrane protein TolC
MKISKLLKAIWVGFSVLFVVGCTTVPKDGGIMYVEEIYAKFADKPIQLPVSGIESALAEDEVNRILSGPVSLREAERMSIELNPVVKAGLSRVGIAEADYAQAGRLENPGFSYERYSGDDYSTSLLFDIGGLFLMPLRRDLESRRLEVARYEAAGMVLEHIADTRRAWINAVAQSQQTNQVERALESAEVGNNMIRQMTAIGHSSVREAAESELLLNELRSSLSRQRLAENASRETLIRQLGLWGEAARMLSVPDSLPSLPEVMLDIPAVEQQAIEGRLDVQMARLNLEGMATNLRLTRLNPFLSAIELGPSLEKAEGAKERGYELELRIPIFDAGGIQNKKAKYIFEQAQTQAEATAISAASTARQALSAYRSTYEIAKNYRDNVLPLRQRVSQENLLLYNGMLISVFDLLEDVRSVAVVESGYINAVRDFWIADTNLQQALTGSGPSQMNFEGSAMATASVSSGEGH